MKHASAHEILRRLFAIIVREAERNQRLARELLDVLPGAVVTEPDKPRRTTRRTFDAASLHAVNTLRTHGDNVLRGKLEQIRQVADLKAVAKASGLVLTGKASKAGASRADLIDGIVSAAKHYDAQRTTAAS
jgi:hypothetical protein